MRTRYHSNPENSPRAVLLKLPPEDHAAIVALALRDGKTIRVVINSLISKALENSGGDIHQIRQLAKAGKLLYRKQIIELLGIVE
jgi:hypothetical protein